MSKQDDILEELFRSKNPADVVKFYDFFPEREELIDWMRMRPHSSANIHTINGDTDYAVVIPTIDINGKFSRKCIDEIYKGLYVVVVESGHNDFFFNIARNTNLGIEEAMKVNPKWIILSTDDMVKAEPIYNLTQQLSKIGNENVDVVFTRPQGKIHSLRGFLGSPRSTYRIAIQFADKYRRAMYKLNVKYNGKNYLTPVAYSNIFNHFLYSKLTDAIWTVDFSIFSSGFIRKLLPKVFDEIYINAHEDADLSIRLVFERARKAFVKYEIENLFGGSLGRGYDRNLRSIPSVSYLNYKYEKKFFDAERK
jgi:hypothetical protein